ncbi:hypothetical protein Ancab_019665, partial [Ancistrocladus abbreviatus]
LKRILGNGRNTLFWTNNWTKDTVLSQKLKRLFNVAQDKELTVAEMGEQHGGSWTWVFRWRRNLL